MNAQERALISMALGQLPKVGGVLSGVFDILNPDTFNSTLLQHLKEIEDTLTTLENQLTQLGLDLKMDQLYAEENQAEAKIDSWYHNHVKDWLAGNNTNNPLSGPYLSTEEGTAGAKILSDGTQMLDNINSAILGQLDNAHNKWLQLVIEKYLAVAPATRMDSQIDSYVEMAYKYWLHLVHLQLKGIACLRAINSDQLGQYVCVVRDNIIRQGLECQKIVNQYLSNGDFTWVCTGGSDWPPSGDNFKITDEDNRYVNTGQTTVDAGDVSAGIQFGWPSPGRNQWGMQLASGILQKDGSITTSDTPWGAVPFGDNVKLVPHEFLTHTRGFMEISTDGCSLPPGQVITGVQLQVIQKKGWPDDADFYNTFGAVVTYNDVRADGSLGPDQSYTLSLTNIDQLNDQYVAVDQYQNQAVGQTSTPVTGFGLTTLANQMAVRLQTSIHQNAFGPVPIDAVYWSALYSPAASGYLTNDGGSAVTGGAASGSSQGFLLLGLSDPPLYGDEVTIMQTASPLGLLGVTGGQVGFGSPGTATHGRWTLVNPANVKGDYGSDPVPQVYNWSAVLLKLAGSDQDLYLKADASSTSVSLGTPSETQLAQVNDNVTRIDDSSYYWNAQPSPDQTIEQQPLCVAWAGTFEAGAAQAQLLYYWPQTGSWWLGLFDSDQNDFAWKPVGNTQGFGNLDDGRPFWTGDFSGNGQTEILFYYGGDGNFWLGGLSDGSLQWGNPGNSGTLGDLSAGLRFWTGRFSGGAQTEVLVYVNETEQLWLGTVTSGQLAWANVGNTTGFGQINDGRPIWTGDFTGSGATEFLFYYSGDHNWWLGTFDNGVLQWSQPGSGDPAKGCGGQFSSFCGAFSAAGQDQILVYNHVDSNWHLAAFDAQGTLSLSLAGNQGFGDLGSAHYKVLIEDFTGAGTEELYVYEAASGVWYGSAVSGTSVTFTSLATENVGAANATQTWVGKFPVGASADTMIVFNAGAWYQVSQSGSALSFTRFGTLTPGLVYLRDDGS